MGILNFTTAKINEILSNSVTHFSDTVKHITAAERTAWNGKAPGGYGLGGIAKILTSSDDLNNIKTTGWYCYHRSMQPANVPTPEVYSAVMEVIFGIFSGQTVQRVYSTGDDNDWNLVAQRVFYGSGGWQPWEWVNPPMQLGVEYRTTERHRGKPVYVKLVDCGLIADNKNVAHGISNTSIILSFTGVIAGGPMPQIYNHLLNDPWTCYVVTVDKTNIVLACGSSVAGTNCQVMVKYTKTTD